MMYSAAAAAAAAAAANSAYKLNKQGDNIQPWRTPFHTDVKTPHQIENVKYLMIRNT